MTIHAVLCRYLPPQVANVLTGLWFALLLGMILLCGLDINSSLRYENF